jgi:hypothetical protein
MSQLSVRRTHSLLFPWVAALALVTVTGCGGSSPTGDPPPTPPPPQPTVVASGNPTIAVNAARGQFFSTDRAGTIDATIDYTFSDSRIVVWIARGRCTPSQFAAQQCDYAATSFTGVKPRRVSVTSAAAGRYTFIVGNGGPRDETIAYQVVLTPNLSVASVEAVADPAVDLGAWSLPKPMRP